MGAPELATHAALALHVLFELGDPRSEGFAYLATLPGLAGRKASPSVPLLWTPTQVATLRGTPTHGRVLRRAKFVSDAHAALFPGGGGGVPREKFAWALSSVLSRASSGDRMPYAFLPGADLLNHGGVDANCELSAVKLAMGNGRKSMGRRRGHVASPTPPRANSSPFPTATSRTTAGCCACTGSPRAGTFTTDGRSSFASPATRSTRGGRPGDGARVSMPRDERYFGFTAYRGSPPSLSTRTVRAWTRRRSGDRAGGAAVFRDPTLPRPETIDDDEERGRRGADFEAPTGKRRPRRGRGDGRGAVAVRRRAPLRAVSDRRSSRGLVHARRARRRRRRHRARRHARRPDPCRFLVVRFACTC